MNKTFMIALTILITAMILYAFGICIISAKDLYLSL